MEPSATAMICDDFRVENNGKVIIIGLYPQGILFSKLPTVLSQLFVIVTLTSDIKAPVTKFTVRVSGPGFDVINPFDQQDAPDVTAPDVTRLEMTAVMPMHALTISEPGTMTITVRHAGGELRARRVPIGLANAHPPHSE